MNQKLRIVMAQINSSVGNIEANRKKILEYYRNFGEKNDLIVFPECALSGYPLEDLVFNKEFLLAVEKEIEILRKRINNKAAMVIGAPINEKNKIFNSLILIENCKITAIRHKKFLPNYGVFDEKRNYSKASKHKIIKFRDFSLGIGICEDMMFSSTIKDFQQQKADILIFINASPYEKDKRKYRHKIATDICEKTKIPLLYVNIIGGQDEIIFDGRSFCVNEKAVIDTELKIFQEDSAVITIAKKNDTIYVTDSDKTQKTLPETLLSPLQTDYLALVCGLRDYVAKNGFNSVLLGLSGGIDSAICASLAVDALGCGNVTAIILPSKFTPQNSIEHALDTAKKLDIAHHVIYINPLVDACEEALEVFIKNSLRDETEENIQARLRGVILMAISNKTKSLLLTTGNKSEIAVGYATLYGDMNGAYNPIKDVYKTQVFALAKLRNKWFHPLLSGKPGKSISSDIIEKLPSAELRPGQTDQDSLPPYEILDSILQMLIENKNETKTQKYSDELIADIHDKLTSAEYKRTQAAIGTKISSISFGRDWRYPNTNFFRYK